MAGSTGSGMGGPAPTQPTQPTPGAGYSGGKGGSGAPWGQRQYQGFPDANNGMMSQGMQMGNLNQYNQFKQQTDNMVPPVDYTQQHQQRPVSPVLAAPQPSSSQGLVDYSGRELQTPEEHRRQQLEWMGV